MSKGYSNYITAAERIDLTGLPTILQPNFEPTTYGAATYTHIVGPYPGPTPKGIPGSVFLANGPGPMTNTILGSAVTTIAGTRLETTTGLFKEVFKGLKTKQTLGADVENVVGAKIVNSITSIFLN